MRFQSERAVAISTSARPKAMRYRIRGRFNTLAAKERFDRTWPIFRYIYATNVGYFIFAHRKTMKLQVVNAPDGTEFITADQPAINTHGAFLSPETPVQDVELFYPQDQMTFLAETKFGIFPAKR